MEYKELVDSAANIPKVSSKTAEEYENKIAVMVGNINETMLQRADIMEMVGQNNIEMMKDNHNNHAYFIASILKNFNPEVLCETILWVFRAYRSRKFHSSYWAAQLNAWREIINKNLTNESANEIKPLYNWMQLNIPTFTSLSDEKLSESDSKHLSN
jgi:hypothetical protein